MWILKGLIFKQVQAMEVGVRSRGRNSCLCVCLFGAALRIVDVGRNLPLRHGSFACLILKARKRFSFPVFLLKKPPKSAFQPLTKKLTAFPSYRQKNKTILISPRSFGQGNLYKISIASLPTGQIRAESEV